MNLVDYSAKTGPEKIPLEASNGIFDIYSENLFLLLSISTLSSHIPIRENMKYDQEPQID